MKKFLMILGVLAVVAMVAVADDNSPTGPVIVANRSFVGQTAPISTTTVYTPTADGNFMVACYATLSSGSTGEIIGGFNWTDEFTSYSVSSSSGGCNGGGTTQPFFIHVKSGTPIQITMTWPGPTNGSTGTGSFDLFVTVVKE